MLKFNNNTHNNIVYVDYVKAFTIALVILGHTNFIFSSFIYSFHIPLFFFISGYFLKELSFTDELVRNVKKLLIPYIILSIFSVFMGSIKNAILGLESYTISKIILGFIYGMNLDYISSYGFVLWFILALFISRMIVNILKKSMSLELSIIVIIIIGYLLKNFNLPFCISQGTLGALWLLLGNLYYNNIKTYFKSIKVYLLLFFILIILSIIEIPNIDIGNLIINHYAYYIIYDIIILVFIDQSIDKLLGKFQINWLSMAGKNTMFIYVLHPYTNNIGYIISRGRPIITFLISISLLIIIYIIFKRIKLLRRLIKE